VARLFRMGLSVAGSFVYRCLTNPSVPRFHLPLVEPDRRISRIRLPEGASRLLACNAARSAWTRMGVARLTPISGPLLLRTFTPN
jgi:hypothetical protein